MPLYWLRFFEVLILLNFLHQFLYIVFPEMDCTCRAGICDIGKRLRFAHSNNDNIFRVSAGPFAGCLYPAANMTKILCNMIVHGSIPLPSAKQLILLSEYQYNPSVIQEISIPVFTDMLIVRHLFLPPAGNGKERSPGKYTTFYLFAPETVLQIPEQRDVDGIHPFRRPSGSSFRSRKGPCQTAAKCDRFIKKQKSSHEPPLGWRIGT